MKFLFLRGEERKSFLQSKYEYYSNFNKWCIIIGVAGYVSGIQSDGVILGHFPWETLLNRCWVLILLLLFLVVRRICKNYLVMYFVSYGILFAVVVNNFWLLKILPDISHAGEGYMEWLLLFFTITYATPFIGSVLTNLGFVGLIYLSSYFIPYDNLDAMMSFLIPCVLGITAANYCMNLVYFDHYKTKNSLEMSMLQDPLTGLYNRNMIKNTTDKNGNFFIPANVRNISCLMIDIDLFKNVNDTYGHSAGDSIIVWVAEILKYSVRQRDIVIRWGGEEFFILLYDCDLERSEQVAERIRKSVAIGENSICPITISVGVALHQGNKWEDTLRAADDALLKAKASGRNQVVVCSQRNEYCSESFPP